MTSVSVILGGQQLGESVQTAEPAQHAALLLVKRQLHQGHHGRHRVLVHHVCPAGRERVSYRATTAVTGCWSTTSVQQGGRGSVTEPPRPSPGAGPPRLSSREGGGQLQSHHGRHRVLVHHVCPAGRERGSVTEPPRPSPGAGPTRLSSREGEGQLQSHHGRHRVLVHHVCPAGRERGSVTEPPRPSPGAGPPRLSSREGEGQSQSHHGRHRVLVHHVCPAGRERVSYRATTAVTGCWSTTSVQQGGRGSVTEPPRPSPGAGPPRLSSREGEGQLQSHHGRHRVLVHHVCPAGREGVSHRATTAVTGCWSTTSVQQGGRGSVTEPPRPSPGAGPPRLQWTAVTGGERLTGTDIGTGTM